jgi:chemotaxis signal transduction protein
MKDKKGSSSGSKGKTVSLSLNAQQIRGKNPVLLFTASQIDEVLAEAEIQRVPFTADHFIGLCAWREQVLPVIDLVYFFGLTPAETEEDGRYVVVRTVDNTLLSTKKKSKIYRSNKIILRCVLKVSDQIISGDIPSEYEPLMPKETGFTPFFIKGLFQSKKELFLLPDLAKIIHSDLVENNKQDKV